MQHDMKNVIAISSHVAYGAVGNRIIVPALEALGTTVTCVNTVELPWHPGMNMRFGNGTRIVPEDAAFAAMIDNVANAPWLGDMDGLITGYLGAPAQAQTIAKLVKALKHANPDALYLCDPVIGDTGGLYVPEVTAIAIRQHLWPLADIVTPNLFEFGWMTQNTSTNINDIVSIARDLNKRHIVVTSVSAGENRIGNVLVSGGRAMLISHDVLSPTPNGTGDMVAALFLGNILRKSDAGVALANSVAAVLSAIKQSSVHHNFSLSPERLHALMGNKSDDIRSETIKTALF